MKVICVLYISYYIALYQDLIKKLDQSESPNVIYFHCKTDYEKLTSRKTYEVYV